MNLLYRPWNSVDSILLGSGVKPCESNLIFSRTPSQDLVVRATQSENKISFFQTTNKRYVYFVSFVSVIESLVHKVGLMIPL